jgi:hypothetical protein
MEDKSIRGLQVQNKKCAHQIQNHFLEIFDIMKAKL